jgi:Ca2+-binding EF-hand superfamily protein
MAKQPSRTAVALAAVLMLTASTASAQRVGTEPPPAAAPSLAAMLPAWFAEMDADKDGYVTREEFAAARIRPFMVADKDGDGVLTREEFLALASPPFTADGPGLPPREERVRRFEDLFQQIDVDLDGKLTRDEIEVYVMPPFARLDTTGDGKVSKPEAITAFRADIGASTRAQFMAGEMRDLMEFDANRDGKVSLEEFLASALPDGDRRLPPGAPPLAQRRQIVTQRFREADGNKDGFLEPAEWTAYLTGLFAKMDTNNDGIITRQEMETYGRSSAVPPPPPRPVPPRRPDGALPDGAPLPTR